MTSSGVYPKIARALSVAQKTPGAVVQDPEPRLGGVRRQGQALLALPQGFVGALSRQRVGEDLRDQLQPLHQRVRPVALRPQGIEAQGADGRLAPHREREGQIRLDAEEAAGSRGRRRPPPGDPPAKTTATTRPASICCRRPGELLLAQRLGRLQILLRGVDVGGRDDIRVRADHCQSTARSMPRTSQTRRSASSISRSTSPGGRLMNLEERSEISVSNSRRHPSCSGERGISSASATRPRYTIADRRGIAASLSRLPSAGLVVFRGHSPSDPRYSPLDAGTRCSSGPDVGHVGGTSHAISLRAHP